MLIRFSVFALCSLRICHAQLSAPVAGLLANAEGTEIRAIVGSAGASSVELPMTLPRTVRHVYLAPAQTWALVEQAKGPLGMMLFQDAHPAVDQGVNTNVVHAIGGTFAAPDAVAFSPNGSSAALLSGAAIQIVRMNGTAQLAWQAEVSGLPSVSSLSVSDDGALVLVLTREGALYSLSGNGVPQIVAQTSGFAAVTFLPNQMTAVIYDAGKLTLLENLTAQFASRVVVAGLENQGLYRGRALLQISRDGRFAFSATYGGHAVNGTELATGETANVESPVNTVMLDRLRDGETFLLSAEPGSSAWLLVAQGADLGVVFAPRTPARRPAVRPAPSQLPTPTPARAIR